MAGVVQHVGPEAAQRLTDGGQRGVVQVLYLDAAGAGRLVERPLDDADLLLGVQRPLVIGRRDHHQDAQRRGRGRGVEPAQAVRHTLPGRDLIWILRLAGIRLGVLLFHLSEVKVGAGIFSHVIPCGVL